LQYLHVGRKHSHIWTAQSTKPGGELCGQRASRAPSRSPSARVQHSSSDDVVTASSGTTPARVPRCAVGPLPKQASRSAPQLLHLDWVTCVFSNEV